MGENNSSLKKYGIVLLIGALGGWYFESHISNYFSKVEERGRCLREIAGRVLDKGSEAKPEPVKETVDGPIVSFYEKFFGKKESVDDKVTQE
jgi:hypothetical protein